MKIALGCDHAAIKMKNEFAIALSREGYEVIDFGTKDGGAVDYPDYALPVAEAVASGKADRGILICGTGIGMSIAANKVKGVRCALCSDTFSARACREHNDANVLAFGERVIGPGLAKDIVDIFLTTPFSGAERHARRVEKIAAIENKYMTQEREQ